MVDLAQARRDREAPPGATEPYLTDLERRQIRALLAHAARMQAELQAARDEIRELKQALTSGCPQARRILTDR